MKYILNIANVVLIFLLCSCGAEKNNNKIIVGISADNPPYEFLQENNITGFDIELIEIIAQKMQKNIELKNMDFNGLIPALTSKSVDMVISGVSVTEERKKSVDFSIIYLNSNTVVLFKKTSNISSEQDLANKMIGASAGTTWEEIAKSLSRKYTNTEPSIMSNNLMLIEELKNSRISAVVLEKAQALKFIQENSEFSFIDLVDYSTAFAIALPKNSELKTSVDKIIEEMKLSGEMKKLTDKWFN